MRTLLPLAAFAAAQTMGPLCVNKLGDECFTHDAARDGRVAATPRLPRGCFAETGRGDAAAATWKFSRDRRAPQVHKLAGDAPLLRVVLPDV